VNPLRLPRSQPPSYRKFIGGFNIVLLGALAANFQFRKEKSRLAPAFK
jgi:hypothetical protein